MRKKEKIDFQKQPFQKIGVPIWKIKDFKDIIHMAIPIFIQLIFNVFITQINIIAINWYMKGLYSEAVSKAVLTYNTLQFIPSLIASGTIVVAGNLIGQGRNEELSKVIVTGILINALITGVFVLFSEVFASDIVKLMNARDIPIPGTKVKSELEFITMYYRLLNIQLFVLSISQVFIAGLQSIKKSLHVTIGAVMSNVIDVIYVTFVLFVFKIDPIWSALSIVIAAFFQLCYMMILNLKLIDFKKNRGHHLNKVFAAQTIKTGLPITLEMSFWFFSNFVASTAIARLSGLNSTGENSWIVLHRTLTAISQYSFVFSQALGTVTAVFVSRAIGYKNIQKAYEIGIDCWKTAIYASLISTSILFAFSYLLLMAFNIPTDLIVPWGLSLFALLILKQIFDTVNLTLLRALWAVGDLWFPLIISFFTMSLGMIVIPYMVIYAFNVFEGPGLIIIYIGFILDPAIRALVYIYRWLKGNWQKYILYIK